MSSTQRRRVQKWDGAFHGSSDQIAVEEPLEVEVDGRRATTTMRTPGHDIELALGWLVSEGHLSSPDDVADARECFEDVEDAENDDVRRLVKVRTREGIVVQPRLHVTSSACGVCGSDAIHTTLTGRRWDLAADNSTFTVTALLQQPDTLRNGQTGFALSGGLHAAGLFSPDGSLVCLREDVGRHNAVDKVIGWALMRGMLPLRGHALQVSGRASAELVHKAVMAGIPLLAAVSAPSTLAVDLAREADLTLAAFVRPPTFTVYSAEHRIPQMY